MIDEDLRTLIVNLSPAGTLVEKGKISETQVSPRIYFQRSSTTRNTDLDGTEGISESVFDIEVGALDDDVTQTITDQLKEGTNNTHGLNAFRGVVGGSTLLGVFVEDHTDDYQPKLLDADEGYMVASFQATVVHS